MELNKKRIRCFKKVYEAALSREETAESVVPDTQPDIAEILDTDGMVMLRSKDSEPGRAGISGSISATVLYRPEAGWGVKALNVTMNFSVYAESAAITEESRLSATVRICAIEARMLNPRKVLIRAEVLVTLSCFEEGELEVFDGLEDAGDTQVLLASCRFSPVTDVREKTFVINEEFQMPATKPVAGELLKQRVELVSEEVKSVGNRLIFKGAAQISLLYAASGDSPVSALTFSAAFSQILEMDEMSEQADAEIRLMLTGAYFETHPDGRSLTCELHLVAQAIVSDNGEMSYIADAYSNTNELRLESEVMETVSIERRQPLRETIRDTIETSATVRDIIQVYPVMGIAEVSGGRVRCPVTVTVIYSDDADVIRSVRRSFTVESSVEIGPLMEAAVTEIRGAEAFASPAAGGLEFRMPVDIDLLITSRHRCSAITGIEVDEESPVNTSQWPSVTVLMRRDGADVWELAKRYRSTPELIEMANSGEGDDNLLLIPRAR